MNKTLLFFMISITALVQGASSTGTECTISDLEMDQAKQKGEIYRWITAQVKVIGDKALPMGHNHFFVERSSFPDVTKALPVLQVGFYYREMNKWKKMYWGMTSLEPNPPLLSVLSSPSVLTKEQIDELCRYFNRNQWPLDANQASLPRELQDRA